MNRHEKKLKFRNEDEEREFWSSHDSTDYIDWEKGKKIILSNLKEYCSGILKRIQGNR
ncbi:hypothetical protein KAW08_01205 [bacterium]|nr:hypothetical protein [bacterium]